MLTPVSTVRSLIVTTPYKKAKTFILRGPADGYSAAGSIVRFAKIRFTSSTVPYSQAPCDVG
jgi:hypothetical protein